MSTDPRPIQGSPIIIIETSPTPNGDLHIGHLSGPFIGADIYARYMRARGHDVIFSTGTDDSQTYVLTGAKKRGITPASLAADMHEAIGHTLRTAKISVDGYAPYDEEYRSRVLEFLIALYDNGKLHIRTVPLPYDEEAGEFAVEGMVAGGCPVCAVYSRGSVCEMCGHPNNFDELIDPYSVLRPDSRIVFKDARVLVLPMEEYRAALGDFFSARASTLRPRTMKFVREAMARRLPDFPITYPISYGIPSPFAGTEGQVINAWAEGIPAAIHCTVFAAKQLGYEPSSAERLWTPDADPKIVYFIGSDIVYFWCLTHLALLMARGGRFALPSMIISNEFYELENDKFSTTRQHVLYLRDLLPYASLDEIRFYLALTGPEHQKTSFSRTAMDDILRRRLAGPWNQLATILNDAAEGTQGKLPVTSAANRRAVAVINGFIDSYEITMYSPAQAAEQIVAQLGRLLSIAQAMPNPRNAIDRERVGDLFLEVKALLAGASPILVDLTERAQLTGGWDGKIDATAFDGATVVRPFLVPPLGARDG